MISFFFSGIAAFSNRSYSSTSPKLSFSRYCGYCSSSGHGINAELLNDTALLSASGSFKCPLRVWVFVLSFKTREVHGQNLDNFDISFSASIAFGVGNCRCAVLDTS